MSGSPALSPRACFWTSCLHQNQPAAPQGLRRSGGSCRCEDGGGVRGQAGCCCVDRLRQVPGIPGADSGKGSRPEPGNVGKSFEMLLLKPENRENYGRGLGPREEQKKYYRRIFIQVFPSLNSVNKVVVKKTGFRE